MEKTAKNKQKDIERNHGKIFIKFTSLNYRQSGGVEFRGKYLTHEELGRRIRIKELANLFRELEKKEKEKKQSC